MGPATWRDTLPVVDTDVSPLLGVLFVDVKPLKYTTFTVTTQTFFFSRPAVRVSHIPFFRTMDPFNNHKPQVEVE